MNKFNSIFDRFYRFSASGFYKAIRETRAENGVKSFSCWGQFVAMLFCQLGQAHSLQEICGGLATCWESSNILVSMQHPDAPL
jgi:hypothetical protein